MFNAPVLSAQQYRDLGFMRHDYDFQSKTTHEGIVENLQLEVWACVVVSFEHFHETGDQTNNFLIVEWKEDGKVAERVAFIQFTSRGDWEKRLGVAFQNLERRDVHLI